MTKSKLSDLEYGEKFVTKYNGIAVCSQVNQTAGTIQYYWVYSTEPSRHWNLVSDHNVVDIKQLGWPDDFVDPGNPMRDAIKTFKEKPVRLKDFFKVGNKFTDQCGLACYFLAHSVKTGKISCECWNGECWYLTSLSYYSRGFQDWDRAHCQPPEEKPNE